MTSHLSFKEGWKMKNAQEVLSMHDCSCGMKYVVDSIESRDG